MGLLSCLTSTLTCRKHWQNFLTVDIVLITTKDWALFFLYSPFCFFHCGHLQHVVLTQWGWNIFKHVEGSLLLMTRVVGSDRCTVHTSTKRKTDDMTCMCLGRACTFCAHFTSLKLRLVKVDNYPSFLHFVIFEMHFVARTEQTFGF